MKRLLISFVSLILIFGTSQIFAQEEVKPRKIIMVEISVPNFEEPHKQELLINRTPKAKYEFEGGGGQFCSHCDKSKNSFYAFTLRAFRIGKDKASVGFGIKIEEKCKTQKIFTVHQNQPTKLQLNCGVSLIAYYGLESEEAN